MAGDEEQDSPTSFAPAVSEQKKSRPAQEPTEAAPTSVRPAAPRQDSRSATSSPVDRLVQYYQQPTNDDASAKPGFVAPRQVASQPHQQPVHPGAYDAAVEQRDHPRYHANAAQGWQRGPTGFVGFDQYYGTNAGTANRTADAMRDRAKANADTALGGLQKASDDWRKKVDRSGVFTSVGNPWAEPGRDYGADVTGGLVGAQNEMDALGRGASGVQALDPTMSRFGAALTGAAGQPQFDKLREQYDGLDTALADQGVADQQYAADVKAQSEASYENAVDAMHEQQAADAADPYLQMAQAAGYASVDDMLMSGYATAQQSQGFSGSFEDYKRMWLDQQSQIRGATAAEG